VQDRATGGAEPEAVRAAEALARADNDWLSRLITRWVPLDDYRAAFEPRPDDIKTVVALR